MKKRERAIVHEAVALMFATALAIFIVPVLISERNSITAVAGALMLLGLIVWVIAFSVRLLGKE